MLDARRAQVSLLELMGDGPLQDETKLMTKAWLYKLQREGDIGPGDEKSSPSSARADEKTATATAIASIASASSKSDAVASSSNAAPTAYSATSTRESQSQLKPGS